MLKVFKDYDKYIDFNPILSMDMEKHGRGKNCFFDRQNSFIAVNIYLTVKVWNPSHHVKAMESLSWNLVEITDP